MPVITPQDLKDHYDVIVVGSGAAGGQAAYTLTMGGARVLMLEAGRYYDPVTETPMFQTPADAPLRAASTPDKPRGFYNATVGVGWTLEGEPYTSAHEDPKNRFNWWRSRMLGGRTNHWERNCLRNGPLDFKPKTYDGLGIDWPIDYDTLAPYYDRVERLIGVFGAAEGIENSPDSPDGVLLPPPPLRLAERLAQHRAKALGIPIVPLHRAVLTQSLDADRLAALLHPDSPEAQKWLSDSMRARAKCFWATHCERGCSIKAAYQSPTVHLPPAFASGRLDLLASTRAVRVECDAAGKPIGIQAVDTTTGQRLLLRADAFVLGASSFETVRLLFNSSHPVHPHGLGNSSGRLGRGLTNTVGRSVSGQIPALENLPPLNEDGAGGGHGYAPWWLLEAQRKGQLDFPRGYHIEFTLGKTMPSVHTGTGLEWLNGGVFGKRLKEDLRRYYGSFVGFTGRGEMIPNEQTYCTLDPEVKDQWGTPVLKIHWHWTEHEWKQAEHMEKTFAQLIEAMGGRVSPGSLGQRSLQSVTHEIGGACMGSQRETSVADPLGFLWDAPNVLLADGATFCSHADKNPTLTIMALAWRGSEALLARSRRRELTPT